MLSTNTDTSPTLLSSVFPGLNRREFPSVEQCLNALNSCVEHLASLGEAEPERASVADDTLQLVTAAIATCHHSAATAPDPEHQEGMSTLFMPEYGCTIVFCAQTDGFTIIEVVGPDDWSHVLKPADESFVSTAYSKTRPVVIPSGQVLTAQVGALLDKFNEELAQRAAKVRLDKSNRRVEKDGGLQHTPGFIASLLLAVQNLSEGVFQGGFTDVGMHTECTPRDTTWRLVCAVVEHLLASQCNTIDIRHMFQRFLQVFQLTLLHSQVLLCENDASAANLHAAEVMLLKIGLDNANYMNRFMKAANDVATVCSSMRARMDQCIDIRRTGWSNQNLAPIQPLVSLKDPELSFDVVGLPSETSLETQLAAADGLARKEFSITSQILLEQIESEGAENIRSVLNLANTLREEMVQVGIESIVLLSTLDSFLQRMVEATLKSGNVLSVDNVDALDKLVELYREVKVVFMEKCPNQAGSLLVDFDSRETLHVWALYCCAHQTCYDRSPIFQGFGVSLDPRDLAHLNLAHVGFQQSLLHIHAYLSAHWKPSRCIFSHRSGDSTMDFAGNFAASNITMKHALTQARQEFETRITSRYDEVLRLQRILAELRRELEVHKATLASYEAVPTYNRTQRDNARIRGQIQTVRDAENHIEKIDCNPPEALMLSLPSSDSAALSVLFFLFMPQEFRLLSRASFLAQRMLYAQAQAEKDPTMAGVANWYEYSKASSVPIANASQGEVLLVSHTNVPDRSRIAPSRVSNHNKREDRVWYPDSLDMVLQWHGGRNTALDHLRRGAPYNPFFAASVLTADKFTSRWGEGRLQWMMTVDARSDIHPQRGNRALATSGEHPLNMSPNQFKACAVLRCQPLVQYSAFCIALHDGRLPLEASETHLLVKQMLGHVGPVEDAKFAWRYDEERDTHCRITSELRDAGNTFKESPSNLFKVALLGLVASFYSQFSSKCGTIARDYASFVESWGVQLEAETNTSDPGMLNDVRSRQAVMYGVALTFFLYLKALSEDDVGRMCGLYMKFAACRTFASDTQHKTFLIHLEQACREVMAHHRTVIQEKLITHPDLLYDALSKVVSSSRLPPKQLFAWRPWGPVGKLAAGCFSAVFNDSPELRTVHVDLLHSGRVLINGLPITGLSSTILNDPLYVRSFETRNFQVITGADGMSKTKQALEGFFYDFGIVDGRLRVCEMCEGDDKDVLVLLDDKAWEPCRGVPVRLLTLHSHWQCRNVVLFRGIKFCDRFISFIAVDSCLYQVPTFRAGDDWKSLAKDAPIKFRRLVAGANENVSKVFAKFELEKFVHVFVSSQSEGDMLIYSLPRFQLEFMSDGNDIVSMNWIDRRWKIHPKQCLVDTLLGLSCCIVLFSEEDGRTRLVVPNGEVTRGELDAVLVFRSEVVDAELEYFMYDRHRRDNCLLATTLSSRLHLAALYAASFNAGNDPCLGRPARHVAVLLVRQCWTTSKINEADMKKLVNISQLMKITCPAVHILARRLVKWQSALAFLYPTTNEREGEMDEEKEEQQKKKDPLPSDMAAFKYYVQTSPQSFGAMPPSAPLLESYEHHDMFGHYPEQPRRSICMTTPQETVGPSRTCPPPIENGFVEGVDARLRKLLVPVESSKAMKFPISLEKPDHRLNRMVYEELQQSFEMHQAIKVFRVDTQKCSTLLQDGLLRASVSAKISEAKTWVENTIAILPVHPIHRSIMQLRLASGDLRKPVWRDVVALAIADNAQIRAFNPFLSKAACESVRQVVRSLLMLVVLEDRLERLWRLIQRKASDELVIKELDSAREWDVNRYPEWLVFEVEQEIQIRPLQARFAQFLIDNPSKIGQLQVGEGKTRVILPLIVLALPGILRLNFLSQLLGEATAFQSFTLGSSVQSHPVFTLPFTRDVDVTLPLNIQTLHAFVDLIQKSKGVLCITPQNMLSMSLKVQELTLMNHPAAASLRVLVDKLDNLSVDLFDESDEHLHPREQLVYAWGSRQALPFGATRWNAVFALLLCMVDPPKTSSLQKLLRNETLMVPGTLRLRRAMDEGSTMAAQNLETKTQDLIHQLAKEVLARAYPWVKELPASKCGRVFELLKSGDIDASEELRLLDLPESYAQDVLVLRGLLGGQRIFLHCLTKRHRIDFGIRRPYIPKRTKRLAVPFRGNDSPAARADYTQPECAIVWTYLAYMDDGLAESDFLHALNILLGLGDNVKDEEFRSWLVHSPSSKITKVTQIDLSSGVQRAELFRTFRLNIAAIHFWLSRIVLTTDTTQFASELVRTPWHMTSSGKCRGFSGTNFNHRLLPLHVKQELNIPHAAPLGATNGKMLHLLMDHCTGQVIRAPGTGVNDLLKFWFESNNAALIDAGALVTGMSNREVAEKMAGLMEAQSSSSKRGIVFFSTEHNEWYVRERFGGCVPITSSPVQPREALVYFDDSRCRGADLKLAPDAVGLVTVSAGMTLSKMIQAAGRLRQLGHSQTVRIVAPPSVIQALVAPTIGVLLNYLVGNTVTELESGLLLWVSRGLEFCDGEKERVKSADLDHLYGPPVETVDAAFEIGNIFEACENKNEMANCVKDTALQMAKSVMVKTGVNAGSGLNGESERETEQESEKEAEKEQEIAVVKPLDELDWDIASLLSGGTFEPSHPIGTLASKMTSEVVSPELAALQWPQMVYCTDNFLKSVDAPSLDLYLRLADNILCFRDGRLLLISERETNAVIQAIQRWKGRDPIGVALVRASFCRKKVQPDIWLGFLSMHQSGIPALLLGDISAFQAAIKNRELGLTFVQLFNGDCMYADDRVVSLDDELEHRFRSVEHLISARHRLSEAHRSSLCNRKEKLDMRRLDA